MICFPWEQTAAGADCAGAVGVCDPADTAQLRASLTGELIGLARATDGNEHLISADSTAVVVEGLAATLPGTDTPKAALEALLQRVEQAKRDMVPDCFHCAAPCGKNAPYDMRKLLDAEEDIRSLKTQLLSGIRCLAARACRAAAKGYHEEEVDRFFYKALIAIGIEDWTAEDLLPILQELDSVNIKCMALLERANG